jgi:predicted Rossmann fold nucleotide-binding protein DprA/Smf involved in DNA uptake
MKKMKDELKSISRSLVSLSKHVDKLTKQVDKIQPAKKTAPKKASPKPKTTVKKTAAKKAKTTQSETVLGSVLDVIKRSHKGVNIAVLKAKTGFDSRQISNALYKLSKKGLVSPKSRGLYVAK